jgi:hypothetical protein
METIPYEAIAELVARLIEEQRQRERIIEQAKF